MYHIYVIYSQNLRRYYVGSTENVEKRLQEHNAGKSKYTRAGIPWKLIYTEDFAAHSDALLRERKIKGRGNGRYLADVQSVPPD